MTKEFLKKVISQKSVDTKMYRYALKERGDEILICRIKLDALGTTAACGYMSESNPDGWEIVIALTPYDIEKGIV